MRQTPTIVIADHIDHHTTAYVETDHGKGWVLARPLGYNSFIHRIKATWLVFTGKADALLWIGQ